MACAVPEGFRVLVIEDDAQIRELYQEILEGEGYRVTLAAIPDWEFVACMEPTPHLILLDLRCGDWGTSEAFLKRLKSSSLTATIPVLVCSAHYALLERWHAQLVAWGCGILPKPFDLEALLTLVLVGATARGMNLDGVADAV